MDNSDSLKIPDHHSEGEEHVADELRPLGLELWEDDELVVELM
jgi:hypothetical protein